MSTALSALVSYQKALATTSHNVANLNTPGFRRQVVEQTEAPGSNGVQASVQRDGQVGSALEKDVVEQMSATYAFKANVQVIKTNDQMMGALLNTKA